MTKYHVTSKNMTTVDSNTFRFDFAVLSNEDKIVTIACGTAIDGQNYLVVVDETGKKREFTFDFSVLNQNITDESLINIIVKIMDYDGKIHESSFLRLPINEKDIITNLSVSQRTDGSKIVDIYYDLINSHETTPLLIGLSISGDNGISYTLPTTSAKGDLGNEVSTGTRKHITWSPKIDYPNNEKPSIKIKIESYSYRTQASSVATSGNTTLIYTSNAPTTSFVRSTEKSRYGISNGEIFKNLSTYFVALGSSSSSSLSSLSTLSSSSSSISSVSSPSSSSISSPSSKSSTSSSTGISSSSSSFSSEILEDTYCLYDFTNSNINKNYSKNGNYYNQKPVYESGNGNLLRFMPTDADEFYPWPHWRVVDSGENLLALMYAPGGWVPDAPGDWWEDPFAGASSGAVIAGPCSSSSSLSLSSELLDDDYCFAGFVFDSQINGVYSKNGSYINQKPIYVNSWGYTLQFTPGDIVETYPRWEVFPVSGPRVTYQMSGPIGSWTPDAAVSWDDTPMFTGDVSAGPCSTSSVSSASSASSTSSPSSTLSFTTESSWSSASSQSSGSSASSESSPSTDPLEVYCMAGFITNTLLNGTYIETGATYNGQKVYANDDYTIWYDSSFAFWAGSLTIYGAGGPGAMSGDTGLVGGWTEIETGGFEAATLSVGAC